MPNLFVDHKDRWLALAQSDADYAVLFIRTWIPFNAWYCNTYPDKKNKDRPILDEMKEDNNLFRTRIISLLQGNSTDAKNFRHYLALLHQTLEGNYMPNPQTRITFTGLYFRQNPITVSAPLRVRLLDYKAEIVTSSTLPVTRTIEAIILDSVSNAYKHRYTYSKYDKVHFTSSLNTSNLTREQKTNLESCFNEINPQKKENLILPNNRGALMISEIPFVNDPNLISKAIIELLYHLRCILFHGEIQPSRDNLTVYEYAYHLQRLLIKSLH